MKTLRKSKRFLAFFTALILLLGTLSAAAFAAVPTSGKCGKEVTWSLSGGKLTISGKGRMYDCNADKTPWFASNEKITSLEVKSPVTYIGAFAFFRLRNLKSVKVANSVTDIGSFAFGGSAWSEALKPGPVYLGKTLFTYVGAAPSSYTIKSGVTMICCNAFADSQTLRKVTIPSSVKKIGDQAFYHCTKLSSVSFSKGLERIGKYAFSSCALRSVTLPSTVKTVDERAFESCRSLKTVTLNNGLQTIERGAFGRCEALEKIAIPASVSKLYGSSFAYCSSLKSFSVSSSNKHYFSDAGGVLYNKNKTTLLKYPVGNTATGYTVSSTTKTIGQQAFEKAVNLKKLVLPKNLSVIEDYAFAYSNLASINAPTKLTSLGEYAFDGTPWYGKLANGPVYFAGAFVRYKGTAPAGTLTVKNGTSCIASYALSNQQKITQIVLPDTVADIGAGAFRDCSRLKSINIPKYVREIKADTFNGCSSLAVLGLPAYVVRIGEYALSNTNLQKLKILNPVCVIDKNVFRNDSGEYNFKTIIYGYSGSTAQKLASTFKLKFAMYPSIDIAKCPIKVPTTARYTGKPVTVNPTVAYGGAKLTAGRHYTVSYKNNTAVGKAYVIIKGNAKYGFTGTYKAVFKIVK